MTYNGLNIRQLKEQEELKNLSEYATPSVKSRGRSREEPPDEIRTCFRVDCDRIRFSRSFHFTRDKTQVFINREGCDHYETRMTHILYAANIAREIAECLKLNQALAEAILFGHDCGHTPYGHAGEEALDALFPGGFSHTEHAIRTLEHLEKRNGKEDLTNYEVKDGILNHSYFDNKAHAITKEKYCTFADKFAYLVCDFRNAIKAGMIKVDSRGIPVIPEKFIKKLGDTPGHMLDTMVKDVVYNSMDTPFVQMSDEMFEVVSDFRNFMFENIYFSKVCRNEAKKAIDAISKMYEHLVKNPHLVPEDYDDPDIERNVTDYIASMTDGYFRNLYKEYFII